MPLSRMPLPRTARRACAVLLSAAAVVPIAGTAQADTVAGTYAAVVFPDQNHTLVYDFIDSATRSVDVTMYELRDTAAVNALIGRQRAGVKVRVILDARHTSVNGAAYSALKAAGVGVTYSSSAYVYTHQKTVTVDGSKSLVLTGNLDSTYYSSSRDYGVFDSDADDVAAIEQVFAADYAKTSITPPDGDNLVWSPTDSQDRLLALINGAQTSLDVQELEFGDQALVDAVAAAASRGVTVRVVGMNPDSYGSYFDEVTTAGGSIVTYSSTTGLYIHAKAIVADHGTSTAKVFAGSENFSDNSLNNNRELGLITTDSGVLNTIESTFATDFANGQPY
ncbi:phospholipase D-like domain-containing protein [Streptomyces sp. SP17BM10]|uniref:phospholipase D-like domain-containing protein n=1 Tax=Streptomyces sp. SP17BM10 TaxID=3002530 RepID=UPI002E781F99|nr:phospholipase D-like domain-containing protein [Streptomyces sp. SP17BM10]MEE1788469.1 phospholipase D-like domain-containing protein [Streptomyces sp. SP17BM10]